MGNAQISSLLEKLGEKKINSRKFNEVFQIDEVPLWHFLRSITNSSFLPKPFKPQWEIEQQIKKDEFPSLLDKVKFNFLAFTVKKGLTINEKIKFLISKSGRRDLSKIGSQDVLFIATTDQILEKDGKLEFLEFRRILNSLKRDQKIMPLVLACDPFSKNSFFRLNSYGPLLYDYITPEILKESKRISGGLHKTWKTLDEKSKIRLFTYRGRSYWKFFENDMNLLFSNEFLFTLVKYYLTFKEILTKHDTKVVYLTNFTNFYGLSALGVVYKLDRKVVYSPHGYTSGITRPWGFLKNVIFASGGEKHKKDLFMGGIRKENIVITGFPFFDEIAYLKRRCVSKAKKTVALLTTIVVETRYMEKEEYFKLIHETLAQIKNVKEIGKVVIKLHPNEKYKSEYESIAKSLGLKNIEIIQETGGASLYSVISGSDLLVGFGSTAVLEGLMAGKDAIHLEMLEARPVYEFKKATFCVKKIAKIGEAIKKVLTDESVKKKLKKQREKYLRRAFYAIDGKAHERVANLIASQIKDYPKR